MAKQKQETQTDVVGLCIFTAVLVCVLTLGIGYLLFHEEVKDEWRVSNEGFYATYVQEGNTYHLAPQVSWQTCHTRSFQELQQQTCHNFSTHDDAVAFAKSKGGRRDEVVKP